MVCHNTSQILEIYKWFEDERKTRLPICRVKNKFAMQTVPDGYRDLTLCVIFTGECGLKIIGEIQIHDKQIHDIKMQVRELIRFLGRLILYKMHKLYKVKRAEKPNDV